MAEIDSHYLQRLKSLDVEALNQWVSEHHRDVYRMLRQLTRQTEAAEDLTQQTFIKAWRAIGSFDGRSSLRVWLHAIAYREYVTWRRRHRLFVPLDNLLRYGFSYSHDSDTELVLSDALTQLSEDQREVFILHEVYGHTFSELAVILGVPEGTLKSRSHYAKLKLQSVLKSEEFEILGGAHGA